MTDQLELEPQPPAGEEWLDSLDADAPFQPEKLNGHVRVDDRPEVRLGTDTHRVIAEVQAHLAADPLVYQRSHRLVTVVGAHNRPGLAAGSPVIRELGRDSLLPRLSRYVKLVRIKPPSKLAVHMVPAPPPEFIEAVAPPLVTGPLLACADWPDVRPLVGVSETPVMRPDGSVHQDRGYDDVTGYLYAPSIDYPTVPASPTQADAERAVAELLEVFCDFPHVAPAHKLVPLAALISILARPAIAGPCPAFVFDATVRGSGKTLQGDTVHAVAFGRRAPHTTLPAAEEEREKVLSGYALAGARCVFVDNVKGLLGGPKLEATLTSTEVGFRILGKPDITELPWHAVMLISGNNLQLTDDMRRRLLVSRLESPLEDPTTRTAFRYELPAYALAHRARLVTAALTIVRAYLCHGAPSAGVIGLGEPYGAWCRVVAGSLAFARAGDVTACRAPAESVALDDAGALRALLEGWHRLPGGPGYSSHELCAAVASAGPLDDLREALEVLCPPKVPGGRVDPRALGYALRRLRGRWLGGYRLVSDARSSHGGISRWTSERQTISTT